jgi:hypothetical protein
MKKYIEETNEIFGNKYIRRIEDGSVIPIDPANSDYQRYLRWLENPNEEEIGSAITND